MKTLHNCPHGFTKNANRPMRTSGKHGIGMRSKEHSREAHGLNHE